jgi:hypothetical protein
VLDLNPAMSGNTLAGFFISDSISKSFMSRSKAQASALAQQGKATTTEII